METRGKCRFCGATEAEQEDADNEGGFCCDMAARISQKQAEFKNEVKKGLHPDWVLNSNGKLKHTGPDPADSSYFDQYPHGPEEDK